MPGKQPDELQLPKWVKVTKKRFDRIKNMVQDAKYNSFQARPNWSSLINFNKSKKLLQGNEYSKIAYVKALKIINNIRSNIIKITNKGILKSSQVEVANILHMIDDIFTGKIKSARVNNEVSLKIFKGKLDRKKQEADTTDMPELWSEESAEQKKKKGKRNRTKNTNTRSNA